MTNSAEQPENRLERIEAALDRQVVVNADLRTSVETLRNSTEVLKNSTTELRVTAEALLQVATIHQQNFERLTAELNADRTEWRGQIDRIWEYLQRQSGNGKSQE
ncbi:MAG: hypothetical protein KME30_11460 [Iphinoe sp. HA4291-MV1]|jgi:hypothetical protein|nr:hypothetical protein [Iphinoe sp. HA4291-MV1]